MMLVPFRFIENTGNPSEIPFGVCAAEIHGASGLWIMDDRSWVIGKQGSNK